MYILQNKYVHMVDYDELINIIDYNKYLKTSNIISDIYKRSDVLRIGDEQISINNIHDNIDMSIIHHSLKENVKLLFQYIIDFNIEKYLNMNVNLYSIITKVLQQLFSLSTFLLTILYPAILTSSNLESAFKL